MQGWSITSWVYCLDEPIPQPSAQQGWSHYSKASEVDKRPPYSIQQSLKKVSLYHHRKLYQLLHWTQENTRIKNYQDHIQTPRLNLENLQWHPRGSIEQLPRYPTSSNHVRDHPLVPHIPSLFERTSTQKTPQTKYHSLLEFVLRTPHPVFHSPLIDTVESKPVQTLSSLDTQAPSPHVFTHCLPHSRRLVNTRHLFAIYEEPILLFTVHKRTQPTKL